MTPSRQTRAARRVVLLPRTRWAQTLVAAVVLASTAALDGCARVRTQSLEADHTQHEQSFSGLRGVLLYQVTDEEGANRIVICRLESYSRVGPNPDDRTPVPQWLRFWTDLPKDQIRKYEHQEIVFDGNTDWDTKQPATITAMHSVKRDPRTTKACP